MKQVCKMMLVLSILLSLTMSQTLSTQGVLRDSDGSSVSDGTYKMVFRLYNTETNLSEDWSETHTAVEVLNGVYNVILGETTPLSSLDSDITYWLGIEVNDQGEMSPRLKMTLSPYALTNVEGTTNVFPQSGNVGIGTINPDTKLDINGDISLSGNISLDGTHMTYNSEYGVIDWGNGSSGDLIFRTLGSQGDIVDYTEVARLTQDGFLGIGTSRPSSPLSVNGTVQLISSSSGSNRYHFMATDEGLNFAETGIADYRLFIQDGGNVGIGTNVPGAKLHVNGNIALDGSHLTYNSVHGVINWGNNNEGNLYFRILSSQGDIGISSYTNIATLDSQGNLRLAGDIIDDYDFSSKSAGDMSQTELQQQYPDIIQEMEDPLNPGETILMMNYSKMVPVLVQTLNEQQEMIETLEKRLADLEKIIETQMKEN